MNLPHKLWAVAAQNRALRITAVYAALAAGWIYASDALLALFFSDPRVLTLLATSKGWIFVAVTSALLYAFITHPATPDQEAAAPGTALSIWPPLLIFLVFVAAVSGTGYLVYERIAAAARTKAEETLGAIAELKIHQIADWMDERRGNAERTSHDPFMAAEVDAWLARGGPVDGSAAKIRSRLEGLRREHGWSTAFLLDTNGEVRLDMSAGGVHSQMARRLALEAIRTGETTFWDLHRESGARSARVEIGFAAPLLAASPAGTRAVGAVVMELDPEKHLYPMLERWPLPSESGETLLVRRDGESVLYLNDLRHSNRPILSLRLPLTTSKLVAAQALRGANGTVEGVDYRGVQVLACARRVPRSSWVLVAKLDDQEVNGPVVDSARLVALFGMILVVAAGLATALWLRQQRANELIRSLRADRERTALAKHLDYLTRYANDIILLMDEQGRVIDANERAIAAYGYTREDFLRLNIRDLRAAEALGSFDAEWQAAHQQDGILFETVHRRKDGASFPVEVSARAIDVDGIVLRQSIIRDITERKEAERKIVRLSNLYAALSQMNQAIVRAKERNELLRAICHIAVEFGHLRFAWIGLVDPDTVTVVPTATAGEDAGYLSNVTISAAATEASGRGPIGTAIRSGRSQVRNDFLSDPSTMPWHDAARRAGFRAVAACPLSSEGKVIGALAVYAAETGFFDAETIALFEEMSGEVSFAIENLEREERRRAAEEALRESEEKYRLLFNNEQDAIVVFDAETTRIVEANEAFLKLSGYTEAETRRLHVGDVSGDAVGTQKSIRTVRERGSDRVDARPLRRKDGTEIFVELGLNSFIWRGRRLVAAIIRDITDRKRAEENALLWAKVLEHSAEGMVITDSERRILTVNQAFTKLTGYGPGEAIGANPGILASGRHDKSFYHVMWRTIRESGRWEGEIWNRRKNGEVYLEWLSITAVRNAAGDLTHYVGIFSDITERKESADRIQFLASHDSLTGLPNRLLMNDLVRQSLATARRKGTSLALLFLDLDRFKTINDSLGHTIGDVLLQRVASRLTETVREGDTVARLGGDEFLIMLPELSKSRDAAIVAEKIVTVMHDQLQIDQHELGITASIGISVFPHDGTDVATLIKNADAAMYHAKEHGRNNYQFFTPDMNARAFEALSMEMSLRGALQRNEFTLHYQPQVQTDSGDIIGVEALIRWQHRDLGFVSPERFIPIAEEHGLIVPIGEWVLRTACRQVREWLDAGLPAVPVAVNMSAVQFRQAGLGKRIAAILLEAGIEPQYLELELTESMIMRDAEQAIAVLLELSEMGVSLSIDDFGTGYSSLNYLRRFPIHKLKIDRSFVNDIPSNADAAAITTAIISMGRSLKLRVIAEGVETAEQMEFLRSRQCDELQGFHIGRPTEASVFSILLAARKPLTIGA